MMGSVVLPGTRAEDWPAIRHEIHERISQSLGVAPAGAREAAPAWKELERCEKHGLTHVTFRYHVVDDEWHEGVCVLPEGGESSCPAPAVLCIHGTNQEAAKYSMLDPEKSPNRAYGIELARRGYVAVAVDQFGFGAQSPGKLYSQAYAELYQRYPEWSVDDRHLLDHQRALDVMGRMDFISGRSFGCMGNSLGGRGVMYLTAFDERIAAGVSSTGISPNCSNVYRYCGSTGQSSPQLSKAISASGKMPWDYHELVALCAPRALLVLEPCNDPYNPDVWPVMQSVYSAWDVYKLLGHPERLAIYAHGDGHNTIPDVRGFAYAWFDRFLKDPGK
jgi:dienelactone hydrolase